MANKLKNLKLKLLRERERHVCSAEGEHPEGNLSSKHFEVYKAYNSNQIFVCVLSQINFRYLVLVVYTDIIFFEMLTPPRGASFILFFS